MRHHSTLVSFSWRKEKRKKELESDKEMFVSGFLSKSSLGSDFFGSRRRNWPRD